MRNVLLIFSITSLLVGCAGGVPGGLYEFISENRKNLARLNIGMSKAEVHSIMGQKTVRSFNNPYRTAMKYNKNNEPLEVFYYWTDGLSDDGIQDHELTPVVFVNGKVIGWGREFFSEYINKYEIRIR